MRRRGSDVGCGGDCDGDWDCDLLVSVSLQSPWIGLCVPVSFSIILTP